MDEAANCCCLRNLIIRNEDESRKNKESEGVLHDNEFG